MGTIWPLFKQKATEFLPFFFRMVLPLGPSKNGINRSTTKTTGIGIGKERHILLIFHTNEQSSLDKWMKIRAHRGASESIFKITPSKHALKINSLR